LRFIFAPLSLNRAPLLGIKSADSASVTNAFLETQRRYAQAARDLHVSEALPEAWVNMMGYALLRELRQPRRAAWVFGQNVTAYPHSPNVYDSLGDAVLAIGDRRGARAEFQRAIDTATRLGLTVDTATRRKRDALGKPASK
jgi:hypothetical protein